MSPAKVSPTKIGTKIAVTLGTLCAVAVLAGCPSEKPTDTPTGARGWSFDSFNNAGKCTLPKGKVVLVDVWATWCEPCKKSFPKLQELYVKYKANGFEIAALSADDEKDGIGAFAKTHGSKFPVCWDEKKDVIKTLDPKTMPSCYIFDRKGKLKFTHTGWHDGEEADLEKEIKSLL